MRQPTGSHHQDPLAQGGQIAADCCAERVTTMERTQRGGDRVDENRDHWARGGGAEQLLQRLDGAVVDLHVGRDGDVDASGQNRFRAADRDCFGDVERSFVGAVIADPLSFGTDAERRHQLVEEAVVVVRRKNDDDLRVEVRDEIFCLRECAANVIKKVLRRPGQIEQWAVGHAAQGYGHFGNHRLPVSR